MIRQAKALADKLTAGEASDENRVQRAFLTVYGRPPTDRELRIGLGFVHASGTPHVAGNHGSGSAGSPSSDDGSKLSKWEQYAQVLLSSNEFMYVD
jgi:hypothetical protein